MAKRPDLSSYQRKIVSRYYLHRDTIVITRLQELVSDLYLAAGDEKKSAQLWKRAEKALAGLKTEPPLPPARVSATLNSNDPAKLAELVGELAGR